MTPQKLKNSILQLAIQGKLVEQRPEEGTAEELFARIQEEKQRLIAEKKIKKEKLLPEITDDEKPFDIPENWMWVHLNYIASSGLGKTLDKAKNTGNLQPYLCSINVYWNGISLDKVKNARFEDSELSKYLLQKGDLLICEGGDVGRSSVWEYDITMYYQNALHRVRFYKNINPYFYKYLIECYKGMGIIDRFSKGVTIKHLVQNSLNAMWLPLPPLDEQNRIVAKIEELLPYIDRYEQAWSKLEQFNSRFPENMKKALLQYAIQGKLVEQRPEEGTAEELFAQIQQEKQRLIAEKKIKKEKLLPEITEDEKPFDIPESWKWVHLNSIASSSLGKTLDKAKNTGNLQPYLCSINVYWEGICLEKIKEARFEDCELSKYLLQKGDLLICEGGDVGRSAVWEQDATMYYQNALHRVRFYQEINPHFYKYVIECYKRLGIIDKFSKGVTIKHLVQNSLNALWLPLPPLAEQKRIVEKLEQLLPLCEQLK